MNLMDSRYGGICDLIPDEPVRAERPFSVADERQDVIFAPFLGSDDRSPGRPAPGPSVLQVVAGD